MFKLNAVLSGVSGTAESIAGQRANCHGISAKVLLVATKNKVIKIPV